MKLVNKIFIFTAVYGRVYTASPLLNMSSNYVRKKKTQQQVLIVKKQVRRRTNFFTVDKFKFRKEIGKKWLTNRVVE